jgi:N-formylglutamate amidohydrolase
VKPPVVVHVPHTSTVIPPDTEPPLLLDGQEVDAELLAMTDRYTDELFALTESRATTVRFPVSRLVVDPERFSASLRESSLTCSRRTARAS